VTQARVLSGVEIAESRTTRKLVALYDGQCEVCQASVTWLRLLDRNGQVEATALETADIAALHPSLRMEECLRQLHVIDSVGRVFVGWNAVARLARVSPWTWLIGALGAVPPFRWLGDALYGAVAANRYAISKCRGGACGVARPLQVRKRSTLRSFWTCYSTGLFLRLPIIALAGLLGIWKQFAVWLRTFRRRIDFLGGRLSILCLGHPLAEPVPILFGELFTGVLYDGLMVDPGSPRMRRSLARHVRKLGDGAISAVVATHHHEEHVGNLNWLARKLDVPLYVPELTVRLLQPVAKLPFVRAAIIGQPPSLESPFSILGAELLTASGRRLEVLPAPGHCNDHIVLYDRAERLLIAGDAFMGSYFATPNPDVDSRKWIDTLERLLALDIEILVEGHGHIHTLRDDVSDFPGIVLREDPKAGLRQKLEYLRWLRGQIEEGLGEGLPLGAVVATCFPWGKRRGWETFTRDELIRILSLGHFSRTELVRSFVRHGDSVLPEVWEARFIRK